MKKYYGKIMIWSILVLLVTAALFVGYMTPLTIAATSPGARTYTRSFMIRSMVTYPEVVFIEWPTGNVVNYSTGVPAAGEHFEDNEMDDMAQHGESDFWTFTTPPLAGNKKWVMVIADASAADTAVETDLAKVGTLCYFYNPKNNTLTEADLGSSGDGIFTRPAPDE